MKYGLFKTANEYKALLDKQSPERPKHTNYCKNGICDLNMFDFCRCPEGFTKDLRKSKKFR
jgi:hypothetical protein